MNATDNQQHHDTIYTKAYHAWVSSLSSERRAELNALDLAEPDTRRTTSKFDDETSLLLAVAPDPRSNENENFAHEGSSSSTTSRDVADALASFCAHVRAHPNPLMGVRLSMLEEPMD